MKPITDYRFIFFILVTWQTDANVNIVQTGTKTGEASFQCGTRLVLSCKIDVYALSMSWQNDSSPAPMAECIGSNCIVDPTVAGLYELSSNTSIGIFNLTINRVTLENNGTSYMCGDGSTSVSSLVIVKDYEPTLNESTLGVIEVSSGCIEQTTDVEFKWTKIKMADPGTESDYDPPYILQSVNITMCIGDTSCEPSDYIKKKRSISTVQGGDEDYHLRAVLSYDGFVIKSNITSSTYKIEDEGDSPCDNSCDTNCVLLIVCGILLVINIVVGCKLLYVILPLTGKEDNTEDKCSALTIVIRLNVVSAILWILKAPLFICLLIRCNNPCIFCKIVGVSRIVLGILLLIHLFVWFILIFIIKRKRVDKGQVGSMEVGQPTEKLYLHTKGANNQEQMSNENRNHPETLKTKSLFPKCTEEETEKRISKTTQSQEQEKIDNLILSGNDKIEKGSASGVELVRKQQMKYDAETKGTDTAGYITKTSDKRRPDREHAINKQINVKSNLTFEQEESHALSNSGCILRNNRNVANSSAENNILQGNTVPENENREPYSEEKSNRVIQETKTWYVHKPGSKDDVNLSNSLKPGTCNSLPKGKKSKKSKKEQTNPRSTKSSSEEGNIGMAQGDKNIYQNLVMQNESDNKPGSNDDVNSSNSSRSGNALPETKKSRKGIDEIKNPQNTKPVNMKAEGNTAMTHDEINTDQKFVIQNKSENEPGNKDDNSSMSDNALPITNESRKAEDENKNPKSTEQITTEHNGSETMTRTLSANFNDEQDGTASVASEQM